MLRLQFFVRGLIFALMICSCSIEINQTPQVVPTLQQLRKFRSRSNSLPTPDQINSMVAPGSHRKLVYISSRNNDNLVVSNIQMLDLMAGDISTLFSVSDAWIYYATLSRTQKSWSCLMHARSGNTPATRILYVLHFWMRDRASTAVHTADSR